MAQHYYSSEPERDGFEELLERYVKELPERAGALRAARQNEDAVEAEVSLRRLLAPADVGGGGESKAPPSPRSPSTATSPRVASASSCAAAA